MHYRLYLNYFKPENVIKLMKLTTGVKNESIYDADDFCPHTLTFQTIRGSGTSLVFATKVLLE